MQGADDDIIKRMREKRDQHFAEIMRMAIEGRTGPEAASIRRRISREMDGINDADEIISRRIAQSQKSFGRAVEWLRRAIEQEGKPIEQERLIEIVLSEGYGSGQFEKGKSQLRGDLRRSIAQYATGIAGKRNAVLKRINGYVGMAEWPDEWFA